MIQSFRHKGLEKFFLVGNKAGIRPQHAERLNRQLSVLNIATKPTEMNQPGWRLHPLTGLDRGRWSVWVSGNWRLTFAFDEEHPYAVDYLDYH